MDKKKEPQKPDFLGNFLFSPYLSWASLGGQPF